MPLRDLLAIDDQLRPALLVTWMVPAARVRPHVPAPLELDTLPGPGGAETAFLTLAAVLNVGVHPRILPYPRSTYAQANYRTYVRAPVAGASGGVYFFANFVSHRAGWFPAWALSPNVHYGPARMTGRVPAVGPDGTLPRDATWEVQFAIGGPLGLTWLAAAGPCTAPPAAAPGTVTPYFLTHRLRGYYAHRRGGVGYLPVEHVEMLPWTGHLAAATCAPWLHWGLLTPDEVQHPLHVFLQPVVAFRAGLPRRLG